MSNKYVNMMDYYTREELAKKLRTVLQQRVEARQKLMTTATEPLYDEDIIDDPSCFNVAKKLFIVLMGVAVTVLTIALLV